MAYTNRTRRTETYRRQSSKRTVLRVGGLLALLAATALDVMVRLQAIDVAATDTVSTSLVFALFDFLEIVVLSAALFLAIVVVIEFFVRLVDAWPTSEERHVLQTIAFGYWLPTLIWSFTFVARAGIWGGGLV